MDLAGGVYEGVGEDGEASRRTEDRERRHVCILEAYERMARAYD
jgi:hypothetical protein